MEFILIKRLGQGQARDRELLSGRAVGQCWAIFASRTRGLRTNLGMFMGLRRRQIGTSSGPFSPPFQPCTPS